MTFLSSPCRLQPRKSEMTLYTELPSNLPWSCKSGMAPNTWERRNNKKEPFCHILSLFDEKSSSGSETEPAMIWVLDWHAEEACMRSLGIVFLQPRVNHSLLLCRKHLQPVSVSLTLADPQVLCQGRGLESVKQIWPRPIDAPIAQGRKSSNI